MPFSVATSPAQAHMGRGKPTENFGHDALVQSREMGDVVPETTGESDKKATAKPFAHFVAGG